MECKIFLLIISLNCCIRWCYGQDAIKMTILSIKHFESEANTGVIQCRMTPEVSSEDEYNVESLRTGNTRGGADENPNPQPAVYQSGSHKYYKINMQNNGNNDAFGVFGCKATKDGWKETIVSTTRMRSDADIVPSNDLFTQTVSIGDTNVSISMRIRATDFQVNELRWRNNTYFWGNAEYPSFGSDTFEIDEPIELYHAGIYECHRQGDRSSAKHGLNLLIVRACPHTRWGPPLCESVCDSCYNGGVCDENTGNCICPPGFDGANCLTGCGGNRYGYDCEQKCSYSSDVENKCRGTLFCLVHPFGCSCNAGYGGLDCTTSCVANRFGASCLQSCHCSSDQCNQYTGRCEGIDTRCEPGWTGTNCQECANSGYFGPSCDQECHCSPNMCNRESGLCQGGCLPQWADLFPPYSCQTGLESATTIKGNPGTPVSVNCTAVQGPGGDLSNFTIVLSKSADDLDDSGITLDETFNSDTGETGSFTVRGLTQDVTLYCQMRDQSSQLVAVLAVDDIFYELPQLNSAPALVDASNTSVTISWTAWNDKNDAGDPPIVGYVTYYKVDTDDEWLKGDEVPTTEPLQYTFVNLSSDTDYSFSVATVREGDRGEGSKSPSLEVKTICAVPLEGPQNVAANIAGEKQELVEISWEQPSSDEVRCRSGPTMFTIYYSSTSSTPNDEFSENITDTTATSALMDGLVVGEEYVFYMTYATEGGESRDSNLARHLVPVLPQLNQSPEFAGRTPTSMTVRWKAWDGVSNIGTPPIVGYNLYSKLSRDMEWSDGVSYNDTGENFYFGTVEMLYPDTVYDFSVAAVREGYGGEGERSQPLREQRTTCDRPLASPQDVVTNITGEEQEIVEIFWKLPPEEQIRCGEGVLLYTIYYKSTSNDEGIKTESNPSATAYIIEGLERGVDYRFEMTLLTEGGESSRSNPAIQMIPVLPLLENSPSSKSEGVGCDEVTVTWDKWTPGYDTGTPPVIGYIPYHRESSQDNEWIQGDAISHDSPEDKLEYTFVNLTEETNYEFAIAVVREGYGGEGDKNTYQEQTDKCRNTGAIVGSTVSVSLFLIFVVLIVIFFRMRRDRNTKTKDPKDYSAGTVNNAYIAEPVTTFSKNPAEDNDDAVYANVEIPVPIVLKDFEKYIKTTELEQQFLKFTSEPQFATEVGAKEANKTKNRFKNMIAYDHSRVVLPKKSNDPHSDYYNANYVKNSESKVGFIAAQGPNKASVDDFWRMVCMENVSTIVMLTNLIENGKDRCSRYWPTSVGETSVFGKINVQWKSSEQYANFEKREYLVTEEDKKAHRVLNWHYTTWPDKDIPDQPSTLIEFAKRVKGDRKQTTTPLLVHCSAGVGRTGTFIALCSLMDVVETSEKIDVYGFVAQMREDRVNMVQTAKQFRFLHECLLEVYLTGDTSIPIEKLTTFEVNTEGVKLGKQFKLLAKLDKMSQQRSSRAANESEKCRFPDIIPVEKKRPYLQSQGKNSSSNYINACSVMSYRKETAYIATQSPLPSTIEDFWRLVYDWKCPLIVMLNQLEKKDETVCKYWPDADSSQYGHITVELKEERKENYYMYRIFQVDHAHTQKPISVHHLQLNSWDENNLWDIHSFINAIEKLEKDFTMVEPTVIHCINGVGRTGVVIAVKSEMERIEAEKKVDVFTTVRQMRASNHNLVQTKEEYALCHHLLKLSSPESTYANI